MCPISLGETVRLSGQFSNFSRQQLGSGKDSTSRELVCGACFPAQRVYRIECTANEDAIGAISSASLASRAEIGGVSTTGNAKRTLGSAPSARALLIQLQQEQSLTEKSSSVRTFRALLTGPFRASRSPFFRLYTCALPCHLQKCMSLLSRLLHPEWTCT